VSEIQPISSESTADPIAQSSGERAETVIPDAGRSDAVRGGPTGHSRPPRWGTLGAPATASALAALYVFFVLHYSVNLFWSDEWSLVPIIHAALHSHLTLGALWAQHNENRILIPNLVIVGSALVHTYDSRSIILLGAALFILSYALLLATFRTYVGRSLTPLHALSLGIVWFSLEDTENALWAFQLAWYMIVLFLMIMVFLLLKDWHHRNIVIAVAMVCAVAASFSSLQGLLLWAVGLICLVWDRPPARRRIAECGIWLVVGALTTAIYFRGYTPTFNGPSRSPSFALHHPVEMARLFLVSLGNVVPTTSTELGAHELLGLVLLITAATVVTRSWLDRRSRPHTALPVALIVFGVLFDGSIALGRLGLGVPEGLSSRYTMANLLVLIGIVVFAWGHLRPWTQARATAGLRGAAECAGIVLVVAFLLVQVATATHVGITEAQDSLQFRTFGARTVVNLDRIPAGETQLLVSTYLLFSTPAALHPYLRLVEEDHLGVFAPGPYHAYRSMGPPYSTGVGCSSISGADSPGQRLTLTGCTAQSAGSGTMAAPLSSPAAIRWFSGGTTVVTFTESTPSKTTCTDGGTEATLKGNVSSSTILGVGERFSAAICHDPQGNLSLAPGTTMRF
jgi:hypothetical protein